MHNQGQSSAQPMPADTTAMWANVARDPSEVIREATCRESRHLSSPLSGHAGAFRPSLPEARTPAGKRARTPWLLLAALAFAGLLVFEAGDSLVKSHRQATVEQTPLASVLDLGQ
jgi:hypothetical protein